ncbi:hypothetical protein EIP91_008995 [Steccherinum ochraceum]|uniref:Protein kinase domain-containing protein n=1 Tax=Steccherinum ochraceum TaxID=92696 RepID=A0A4R0R273_9APHY|nr:hypothetical protein EIP91_008995 [Steccherinum ochraceum]
MDPPQPTRSLNSHTIWPRKNDPPTLPHPPPHGIRPPNGLIWGHSSNEFVCIKKDATTVEDEYATWSRSMLQDQGEAYTKEWEEEFFCRPDVVAKPRRRKLWPVLKMAGKGGLKRGLEMDPPMGEVDQGSDHELEGARDVVRVDSEEDIEECEGGPGAQKHFGRSKGFFGAAMVDSDNLKRHWSRFASTMRIYKDSGKTLIFVKPPATLHSMTTLEDFDNYCNEHCEDPSQMGDEGSETDAEVMREDEPDGDIYGVQVSGHPEVANGHVLPSDTAMPDQVATSPSVDEVSALLCSEQANVPVFESKAAAMHGDVEMVPANTAAPEPDENPRSVFDSSDNKPPTTNGSAAEPKSSQSLLPALDPFSRDGIPKLQENIPVAFFPDTLVVHDPFGVSMGLDGLDSVHSGGATFVFRRVYPILAGSSSAEDHSTAEMANDGPRPSSSSSTPEKGAGIAHLHLLPSHRIGTGNHSYAYLSPLTLPAPLTTYTSASARPGTVLVAAKVAVRSESARALLASEAATYNAFPAHLSDEYCGLHSLDPRMETLMPSCAVVPKFFGYYVPVEERDDPEDVQLKYCPWQRRSPILLMEECGNPIVAKELDKSQRLQCYALLIRLHMAQYLHGSFYVRNIVVQPGPLTQPPIMRSMDTPSFRVIDFGRTMTWRQWMKPRRDSDLARFKREALEREKNGTNNKKEKEKEQEERYEKGSHSWWFHREEDMTEEEVQVADPTTNPYWRTFTVIELAKEWRRAKGELLFSWWDDL